MPSPSAFTPTRTPSLIYLLLRNINRDDLWKNWNKLKIGLIFRSEGSIIYLFAGYLNYFRASCHYFHFVLSSNRHTRLPSILQWGACHMSRKWSFNLDFRESLVFCTHFWKHAIEFVYLLFEACFTLLYIREHARSWYNVPLWSLN